MKPCDILKVKKSLGRGRAPRDGSTPLAALFFWTLIPACLLNSVRSAENVLNGHTLEDEMHGYNEG